MHPKLYCYRATREILIKGLNCTLREIRVIELKWVEGRTKTCVAFARGHKVYIILLLRFHGFQIRVCVIQNQYVQDVHMQTLEHGKEGRRILSDVSMSVNRLKGCEFP
jgi:hypothetical protein